MNKKTFIIGGWLRYLHLAVYLDVVMGSTEIVALVMASKKVVDKDTKKEAKGFRRSEQKFQEAEKNAEMH